MPGTERVTYRGWLSVLVALVVGAGCGGKTSTVLTLDDMNFTVEQVSAKLAGSPVFANRTAASPPMTVTIQRIDNRTSDIIPESEQWMFIAKVQAALPLQTLAKQRGVVFQIPPERLEQLRASGWSATGSSWVAPTHVMNAEFRSAQRVTQDKEGYVNARVDQYQMEYKITELRSGSQVWSGIVEFKREALGRTIN